MDKTKWYSLLILLGCSLIIGLILFEIDAILGLRIVLISLGMLIFVLLFLFPWNITYSTIPNSYSAIQTFDWGEIDRIRSRLMDSEFQDRLKHVKDDSYRKFCQYLLNTELSQIQKDYNSDILIRKQINYKLHQRRMLKTINESLFVNLA
jgi:hypothetical protein